MFHDAQLRNNPPDIRAKSEPDYKPFEMQYPIHSKNQPETLAFVERMRRFVDGHGRGVFIGEIGETHHPAERLAEYTAPGRLHLAYNTELMTTAFGAELVRRAFEGARAGSPCWAFSSHDVSRHVTRWAAHGVTEDALAKLCCALLLSLEGAVCLYQGEELGLGDTALSYDELVDPEGRTFWPDNPGRDACRTPMVWEAGAPNAGFSTAERTWLPVKAPQAARAVDTQADDPASVLAFYRRMIALRASRPSLRKGGTRFLDVDAPLLAFRRGADTLCAFNLGREPRRLHLDSPVELPLAADGVGASGDALDLPPNGFAICALHGAPA